MPILFMTFSKSRSWSGKENKNEMDMDMTGEPPSGLSGIVETSLADKSNDEMKKAVLLIAAILIRARSNWTRCSGWRSVFWAGS
jgi:hypothetical protein